MAKKKTRKRKAACASRKDICKEIHALRAMISRQKKKKSTKSKRKRTYKNSPANQLRTQYLRQLGARWKAAGGGTAKQYRAYIRENLKGRTFKDVNPVWAID
jgi:hypothetical protein